MSFEFIIEDVAEIRLDPIGHHKHWTFLVGKLAVGVIHRGDSIEIPYADGLPLAAIVGGFEMWNIDPDFFKRETVRAGDVDGVFGVMTRYLAAHEERVVRTTVSPCTIDRYQSLLLEILKNDPQRFFHCHDATFMNQSGQLETRCFKCPDCIMPLYQLEEARPILQELTHHADAYVAKGAALVLNPPRWHPPPTKRKNRWWAFWRKILS